MKIKYISMLLLGVTLGLTSCDDYLDKEPESNVTPASFFTSADDLAAYTVNLYGVEFSFSDKKGCSDIPGESEGKSC